MDNRFHADAHKQREAIASSKELQQDDDDEDKPK